MIILFEDTEDMIIGTKLIPETIDVKNDILNKKES